MFDPCSLHLLTNSIYPQQYFELRSRNIQKLRESQSPNPYPHKFDVSTSLTAFIAKYGPAGKIPPGKKLDGVTESLAGRIHTVRESSQKLRFYDLHGEGGKVQIMANLQYGMTISFLMLIYLYNNHDTEMQPIPILSSLLTSSFAAVTSSASPEPLPVP